MSTSIVANNASAVQPTAELSWEDIMAGKFTTSPARRVFEETVISRAASAKAALPGEGTRIDRARDLVLANCVKAQADGSFVVHSTSERGKSYPVTLEGCTCPDVQKAPEGRCKHLLATWIWRKARSAISGQAIPQETATSNGHAPATSQEALQSTNGHLVDSQALPLSTQADIDQCVHESLTAALQDRPAPLPEAAASMNCYIDIAGYKVQVTLRGSDEHQVLARLEALLKRFPAPEAAQKSAAAEHPTIPEGWCRLHDEQMQHWPGKDGRKAWWSHRLADGSWCKGK